MKKKKIKEEEPEKMEKGKKKGKEKMGGISLTILFDPKKHKK